MVAQDGRPSRLAQEGRVGNAVAAGSKMECREGGPGFLAKMAGRAPAAAAFGAPRLEVLRSSSQNSAAWHHTVGRVG